jgi:hypothetical protein
MQNVNKRNQIKKEDEHKLEAIEVCDVIISQTKERFNFTDHLIASNLFLVENFEKYFKHSPEEYFNQTINFYPYFNDKKLKTELQIIYSKSEFRNISVAVSSLEFLKTENLTHTFAECVKLLKIIITIPMSTVES